MIELLPAGICSSDFGAKSGVGTQRDARNKGRGPIPSDFNRANPFFSDTAKIESFRVNQMTK